MTAKKKFVDTDDIHPHWIYRCHSKVALAAVGLGPTQAKAAIDRGELERPVRLTRSGRARGWYGSQLLAIKERRLAAAAAEAEAAPERAHALAAERDDDADKPNQPRRSARTPAATP